MSKITIIGGDLIEKIGGSYKIYTKDNFEISSKKQIIFNAKEGIKYGVALPPPLPEVEAKCIVHFRPKSWKGEYGFDWFRERNDEISDNENYEKLVGKYYQFSDKEMSKLEDSKIDAILTKYYTKNEIKNFNSKKNGNTPYEAYYINDDNAWFKKRQKVNTIVKDGKNKEVFESTVDETIENFRNDPQYNTESNSLEKLKEEYSCFQYKKKKKNKKDKIENIVYHGSYIALFPQTAKYGKYEADIELNISILEKEGAPDYLFFKVDGMPLKADHPNIGIDRLKIEKPKGRETVKISCKADTNFTENKKIEIYAVKGNTPEVLAGCLTMIAPVIKELNVVTIGVKTKVGEGDPGTPTKDWLNFYKKSMGQALIKVNIIDKAKNKPIQIDISDTPDFKKDFKPDGDGNIKETSGFAYTMYQKFKTVYPEYAEGYFKLYFVDVRNLKKGEDEGETLGYSENNDNWGVMFSTHKIQTIAHESLHALGLPHSFFFKNNSYVFKAMETYNIMDYSHLTASPATGDSHSSKDRYYTWKWQWEVVRESNVFIHN